MQLPLPGVVRQPFCEKRSAAGGVAHFEKAVGALMRGMSVPRVAGERTLDERDTGGNVSGLDIGPPQITEEPPVVAPLRRQLLKQRQLRLVVIDPPAEAEEAENTERQGQRQCIPGVFRGVLAHQRQRRFSRAFDRQRHRIDMPPLAGRNALAQRLGARCCRPRLWYPRLELEQAGSRDMREGEVGIGRNSAPEALLGSGICRQQQIDSRDIIIDRLRRGCGYRKVETVLHVMSRRNSIAGSPGFECCLWHTETP